MGSYSVDKVQKGAGEHRFPTCRKWLKAFPHFKFFMDAGERSRERRIQVQFLVIISSFQTLVQMIEPKPNWSTMVLYVTTKTIGRGGSWLQQRDPRPQTWPNH